MAAASQQLVRLTYQPPASSIFLSQQISHQQPVSSTFLSEQISTSHQPPAKRTGGRLRCQANQLGPSCTRQEAMMKIKSVEL
jgi:hypothetical protein